MFEISHKYHDAAHQFSDLGIKVSKPEIDVKKLLKNKNDIIDGLTGGIAGLFKKNKVSHIEGLGSFLDKNTLEVTNGSKKEKIIAKNFIIATGSEVTQLPGVEIDEKVIVSSTGALDLPKVQK